VVEIDCESSGAISGDGELRLVGRTRYELIGKGLE